MKRNLKKARAFLSSLSPKELSKVNRFADKQCTEIINTVQIIMPSALALQSYAYLPQEQRTSSETKWIEQNLEYIKQHEKDNKSFNYLVNDPEGKLPDDLDDTAYCLTSLTKHEEEIHEDFILKMLGLESKVGGPYKTWYINPDSTDELKWLDIDPVVNANLLYFMSVFGIALPKTKSYLIKVLNKKEYSSPYYPSDIVFLYFLAKYAKEASDREIFELLRNELVRYDYHSLNILEKIMHLTITTLISGPSPTKTLKELLSYQNEEGAMPESPFCYDLGIEQKSYVSSKAITTAFLIELLALNTKFDNTEGLKQNPAVTRAIENQKEIIEKELAQTPFEKEVREVFPAQNSYKSLYVPNSVAYDLKNKLNNEQKETLADLSVAIYFSWLGYTLLDDILDGQRETKFIPVANTLIRLAWKYFHNVITTFPEFNQAIHKAFQECDKCYLWEAENTKFKEKGNLPKQIKDWNYNYIEDRMQPYLISLKFIPEILGLDKSVGESIYSFFKSQVIIDQLNDDAHDWEEDYAGGNLTFVLSNILSRSLNPLKHQETFWEATLPEVIEISEKEYRLANKALSRLSGTNSFMSKLLYKTIAPIRQAQTEMDKTTRIINKI